LLGCDLHHFEETQPLVALLLQFPSRLLSPFPEWGLVNQFAVECEYELGSNAGCYVIAVHPTGTCQTVRPACRAVEEHTGVYLWCLPCKGMLWLVVNELWWE
jgi:hypothetical protein